MNFLKELKKQQADNTDTVFIHHLNQFQTPRIPWKYGFRPSQISYSFCPRLWALMALGFVQGYSKFDARTKRVVDNGTKVHERYHDYTVKISAKDGPGQVYIDKRYGDPKAEYRCEERLLEAHGIRGKYDCIWDAGDDFLYVVDFKSIKHDDFSKLIRPLDYHIKQLVVYLGLVDELYELDRPIKGLYVYESKDTQEVKEFRVPWDERNQNLYKQLLELIDMTNKAVENKDITGLPCLCRGSDPCKGWDLQRLAEKPKVVNV